MAWEFQKVEDQRKALVESYLEDDMTMSELCDCYGISRKTGYKWIQRYKLYGLKGLKDLSKTPHNPRYSFKEETINIALDLKLLKRTWGPKKVLAKLHKDYPHIEWPSPTRLYEIFKDHHLVTSKRIRSRVPATHPLGELNNSNDVWIADFKGWFLTQDKMKCEPLTITDGFSRYLIKCDHLAKKSSECVWPLFEEAFREYGLPKRLRTDNGPPFGCRGVGRLTPLSVKLIKAGVIPEWINPGHPEENGRHERFHLTLKEAVANPSAGSLIEQIRRMKAFQEEYNYERPHEALNMKTPSETYLRSSREWTGLKQPEYDTTSVKVRKVCPSGCIYLKQREYYLGQVLSGEYVSLKEEEEGFRIHYGPVYLGILKKGKNFEKPKLVPKKIVRRG